MKSHPLKVARIGNSRGVRIPATTLDRYRIGDSVIMEEREDGILLRPVRLAGAQLSWEDTARAMASDKEDWSDLNATNGDGLENIQWDVPVRTPAARRVAEKSASYSTSSATSQSKSKLTSKRKPKR